MFSRIEMCFVFMYRHFFFKDFVCVDILSFKSFPNGHFLVESFLVQRKWLTKLIDAKPKVEDPSPWGDMNHVPPEVWGLCLDMSPQVCGSGLGQEPKVGPCPPSGGMY